MGERATIHCPGYLFPAWHAMQVREYKADLAKLHESSRGAAASAPGGAAARAELGLHDDYTQTSAGQRERLLQTTDKLGRTGERITQGRQQLLETEVWAWRAWMNANWHCCSCKA